MQIFPYYVDEPLVRESAVTCIRVDPQYAFLDVQLKLWTSMCYFTTYTYDMGCGLGPFIPLLYLICNEKRF